MTVTAGRHRGPSVGLSRRSILAGGGAALGLATAGLAVSAGSNTAPAEAAGSWGNWPNGEIPLSALDMVAGAFLRPDAADSMAALLDQFRWEMQTGLGIEEGYRTLDRQIYLRDLYLTGKGNLAAVPGTSNHGWGLAVDFRYPGSVTSTPGFSWLLANAPSFGWTWAGRTFAQVEPWHWEYDESAAREALTPWQRDEKDEQMLYLLQATDNTMTPVVRWALTGPGYWTVVTTTATAKSLALRFGNPPGCVWSEWDAAYNAAVASGFKPAPGQTSRTI